MHHHNVPTHVWWSNATKTKLLCLLFRWLLKLHVVSTNKANVRFVPHAMRLPNSKAKSENHDHSRARHGKLADTCTRRTPSRASVVGERRRSYCTLWVFSSSLGRVVKYSLPHFPNFVALVSRFWRFSLVMWDAIDSFFGKSFSETYRFQKFGSITEAERFANKSIFMLH